MHRKFQVQPRVLARAIALAMVVDLTMGLGRTQEPLRDHSIAESYSLENRGKETPAGKPSCRYATDGMYRAGYPWLPGVFANVGTDPQHSIGYVGGSTPFKGPASGSLQGECRRAQEGTFGADYSGLYFKRNTWLLWTHGRREQGGLGRYETEGPRILPEK